MVNNPPASAREARGWGLISGSRRSTGGGNGNPFQYSCLENSSILAWRIPWTEEPGKLQSMGLLTIRHDWVTEHRHSTKHTINKRVLIFCAYHLPDKTQNCTIWTRLKLKINIYIHKLLKSKIILYFTYYCTIFLFPYKNALGNDKQEKTFRV